MPSRNDIERSLFGAWRLARLDAGALNFFDLTVEGFFRSFSVVLLLLPAQLLMAWLVRDPEAERTVGTGVWLAMRGGLFVVAWIAFLASMAPISRMIGLSQNYVTYVIAWNWVSVVQMGLLLPIGVLYGLGLLPGQFGLMVLFAAWIAILAYDFLVARIALGADRLTAFGVVVYSIVLELVIEGIAEALFPA